MNNTFLTSLIVALLTALISFFCGILLSESLKKRLEQWKRRREIHQKKPVPVRIFFIICPFCSSDLTKILLRQNEVQDLFEFDSADMELWPSRGKTEESLRSLKTNSKLEFAEAFQEVMQSYNKKYGDGKENRVNIAITELPFPMNYYTWHTRDRRGIVIGINSLHILFEEDPKIVNKIILRIVQSMLINSIGIEGLSFHGETRGCLFDFTEFLTNIQYSVDKIFLCAECEKIILNEKGIDFLNSILDWIERQRKKQSVI